MEPTWGPPGSCRPRMGPMWAPRTFLSGCNDITCLHGYCTKWKLKLNTEKSKVMVFKKGRPNVSTEWYFGPHKLSVTNKITYLGIVFASNGSVHRPQTTLAEQASEVVFPFYKKINTYSNLTPDFMMDLFDEFIVPVWRMHAICGTFTLVYRWKEYKPNIAKTVLW